MMNSCLLHPFRRLFKKRPKLSRQNRNHQAPAAPGQNRNHQAAPAAPGLNGVVFSTSVPDDAVSSTIVPDDVVFAANLLQNDKYEHELLYQCSEEEANRLRLDLTRQIHNRARAWESKTGNNLPLPSGYSFFLKGLVGQKSIGVGVAICDGNSNLLFEWNKSFSGKGSKLFAELKALIQGLALAVLLGLKRVSIFTDSPYVYQFLSIGNRGTIQNVASIRGQINLLLRKLLSLTVTVVQHSSTINLVTDFARNAIAEQDNTSAGCNQNAKNLTVSCVICDEKTNASQMFVITPCLHTYCLPCMLKHVQFKLHQGFLPNCPHENCKSDLKLDSCKRFLTPELFFLLSQRLKEASIPAEDKIYCPYPKCSALMSKTELRGFVGPVNCPECGGALCVRCKVPWHSNMSCVNFKKKNPYPCKEDKKLMDLATKNYWRQCPKCSHMVSLTDGCYHIYCRCGHEFCYTCGAEWSYSRATCTSACPAWCERS